MDARQDVYPNVKYRRQWVPFALGLYIVLYFVPGMLLGRYVYFWLGMAFFIAGGVLLSLFAWRCFFPVTLLADRDGFALERRRRRFLSLGYEKIHEARSERSRGFWRRTLGPLVFLEPLWPLQRSGRTRLIIVHGGDPLVLRADEFGRLDEFTDTLKKRNVRGLAESSGVVPLREFGGRQ